MSATYSDDDLDAAVAAGVLTAEAAAGFRALAERRRTAPIADDEQFRLLTGFNDIFVAIAIALVLVALGWLGFQAAAWLGAALVAVASWGLAEFFTRRRRMALPSLLLLLSWEAGVLIATGAAVNIPTSAGPGPLRLIAAGLAAGVAAYAHWRRFKVPITIAAGVCAVLGVAITLASTTIPGGAAWAQPFIFLSGVCVFALALWWDASDPQRKTRRADVAFWLHLAAAPLLVHPLFSWLGMSVGLFSAFAATQGHEPDIYKPVVAVGIYVLLALVALVIDRRALMVSALAYLLYAINAFFRATGSLSVSLALSALIAGAALLLLSVYWRAARGGLLVVAPGWLRASVPAA
jgi:hypothetical protein